jgi:hypothetical protein
VNLRDIKTIPWMRTLFFAAYTPVQGQVRDVGKVFSVAFTRATATLVLDFTDREYELILYSAVTDESDTNRTFSFSISKSGISSKTAAMTPVRFPKSKNLRPVLDTQSFSSRRHDRARAPGKYGRGRSGYDLKVDPIEFVNLAGEKEYDPILNGLSHDLQQWRKKTCDPYLDPAYLERMTAYYDGWGGRTGEAGGPL